MYMLQSMESGKKFASSMTLFEECSACKAPTPHLPSNSTGGCKGGGPGAVKRAPGPRGPEGKGCPVLGSREHVIVWLMKYELRVAHLLVGSPCRSLGRSDTGRVTHSPMEADRKRPLYKSS